jgi:hypothetical protein
VKMAKRNANLVRPTGESRYPVLQRVTAFRL